MSARRLRVIARLDVKDESLVKGIQYEGLRKLGDPHDFALRYYQQGIDELVYLDTVASLYERSNLSGILERTTRDVFIPITAGGGVRSVEDMAALLRAGADKVAVNTAALRDPKLLTQCAQAFGRQCVVLSVQAKRRPGGGWEAYYDNGREHSGRDVLEWVREGTERGAGEIFLTSVDQEGFQRGMDQELIAAVTAQVDIPVISAGGADGARSLEMASENGADAVALGSVLHYGKVKISELKQQLLEKGIEVRV